jgi:3-hydroxyisobutyrate dehydrogenase-like beta-hydroxyacid dehydrogenase
MNPTIAIVAQGAMGSGVGGRLVERGLRVITSLAGRSDASASRARAAGMIAVSDEECAQADFFLSTPLRRATHLHSRQEVLIAPAGKPIHVDCNAESGDQGRDQ